MVFFLGKALKHLQFIGTINGHMYIWCFTDITDPDKTYQVHFVHSSRLMTGSLSAFSINSFFFWAAELGKYHKEHDLANKDGDEARQPCQVSDIIVQCPLCVTKHCHTTTWHHGDQLLVDRF
jgi:hypothetical protein